MVVSIRRATPGDQPAIAQAVREVYDEYGFTWDPAGYHADLYDLEEAYLRDGHDFFVAVLEPQDQVIGCVGVWYQSPLSGTPGTLTQGDSLPAIAGCDCELLRLYLPRRYRGHGIGMRLLQTAVEAAAAKGRARMEIWSDKRFTDAHRLYGKVGARVVGDRICDDPDVSPEWGLVLELDAAEPTTNPTTT